MFYAPYIQTTLELPPDESFHCIKVLRKQAGEQIDIVDGNGNYYRAEITLPHPKRCGVTLISSTPQSTLDGGRVHIAVAPTKNMDRMEWLVEKATEIGIDRITLLRCRYSERKEVNLERLHKIAVSAMKQSLKATLPQLDAMTNIKQFIADCTTEQRTIAHCYKDTPRLLLKECYRPKEDMVVMIGPEGDFSQEEVAWAVEHQFVPVSLGHSRLRTETAALVACHTARLLQ